MKEDNTKENLKLSNIEKKEISNNKESNLSLEPKQNNKIKKKYRQTVLVKERIEEKTLDDLGDINEAKLHRSANKPLHKIKEFDNTVKFCRCCNLPCEQKGVIEPFKCCDDIDSFAECGLGVSLYFYFFRFATLVAFMGICVLAISMMIFNYNFSEGIKTVCNNSLKKYGENKFEYCEGFITEAESINLYSKFNDWILRFSSDNMEVYQLLHKRTTFSNFTEENNNSEDVIINYSILNLCFLGSLLLLNIFYIILISAHSQKAKLLSLTIRDYTVLISNAKYILYDYLSMKKRENPQFLRYSTHLVNNLPDFIKYVNEYIRSDVSLANLEIKDINLCYDIGNYIELRDEYGRCVKKIFKVKNEQKIIELNKDNGDTLYYYDLPLNFIGINCIHFKGKPLIALEKQRSDLEKQINFEVNNIQLITDENFTGYMFVSFNKIRDKEIILERYPDKFFDKIKYFLCHLNYYLCCCCMSEAESVKFYRIQGIDVEDPPDPEDIYWENFKYSSTRRVIKVIVTFLICFLIIAVSFGIVLGFTVLQNHITENNKKLNLIVKYLLSIIISIVISILNAVLEFVLSKVTLREKHLSRTNFYLSLSIKIAVFTFLNSAIIPLIAKEIIVKKRVDYDNNIDRNNLLIIDIFIIFLVNAIVTPLFWTLSFQYLLKKFRIWRIERRENPNKYHYMTQRELNKLYELPDMRIAYKYAYIAKTLGMTLFYFPIFPMGFIISFVGFVLGYFLELFNFSHLYKRPEMIDEIITNIYADYFIVILFIGAIGDYFFLHDIFPSNTVSLITIIVFGALIIVPYTKFITCNFVGINKSDYHDFSLNEVYFTFYNDYQRQNPFTKKVGLINYLTELKKRDYLSNNAFQVAQDNIDFLNIMEIYYGVSRGYIPGMQQSVLTDDANGGVISGPNLKQTVIVPDLHDNELEKVRKQKYFDSQVMQMFGSVLNRKSIHPNQLNSINEENSETKDNIINSTDEPITGMGNSPFDEINNIPLSESVKKI